MNLTRGFCIFWILLVQLSVFECTSGFDKEILKYFQDYLSGHKTVEPTDSSIFADLNCPDHSYPQHWDSHCGKQCQYDQDCLYRDESCLCDGYCGLTCVENSRVRCSTPPDVPNAKHDGSPYQKRFVTSTTLLYTCTSGFSLNIDANVWALCSGRGKTGWIGPNMTCTPTVVDCPILSSPVSGSKNESETAQGRVITFECDDGFKNTGSSERRCLADGTWSGQLAICKAVDCGWPEPLYNGYLIGYSTTFRSTIFFRCNPRTTFEGTSFYTQCLPSGEWSDRVPVCWGQCKIPVVPNAVFLEGQGEMYVDHGTEIQYQCQVRFVPRTASSMRCLNGTWTPTAECIPSQCQIPVVPNAVFLEGQGEMYVDHGTEIQYQCQVRFVPRTASSMRCLNGTWSPAAECIPTKRCDFPGDIEHGWLKVQYYCHDGYELTGVHDRLCQPNGQWNGTKPVCKPVTCPTLSAPEHGSMNRSGTDYGAVVTFKCDDFFELMGSSERRCLASRTWSGEPAKCEVVTCPPPVSPLHGHVDGSGTVYGTVVTFRCDEGFKNEGSSERRCQADGTWSGHEAVCEAVTCPSLVSPVNGHMEGLGTVYGTIVTFRCDEGFKNEGSSERKCLADGTWSGHEAVCEGI